MKLTRYRCDTCGIESFGEDLALPEGWAYQGPRQVCKSCSSEAEKHRLTATEAAAEQNRRRRHPAASEAEERLGQCGECRWWLPPKEWFPSMEKGICQQHWMTDDPYRAATDLCDSFHAKEDAPMPHAGDWDGPHETPAAGDPVEYCDPFEEAEKRNNLLRDTVELCEAEAEPCAECRWWRREKLAFSDAKCPSGLCVLPARSLSGGGSLRMHETDTCEQWDLDPDVKVDECRLCLHYVGLHWTTDGKGEYGNCVVDRNKPKRRDAESYCEAFFRVKAYPVKELVTAEITGVTLQPDAADKPANRCEKCEWWGDTMYHDLPGIGPLYCAVRICQKRTAPRASSGCVLYTGPDHGCPRFKGKKVVTPVEPPPLKMVNYGEHQLCSRCHGTWMPKVGEVVPDKGICPSCKEFIDKNMPKADGPTCRDCGLTLLHEVSRRRGQCTACFEKARHEAHEALRKAGEATDARIAKLREPVESTVDKVVQQAREADPATCRSCGATLGAGAFEYGLCKECHDAATPGVM